MTQMRNIERVQTQAIARVTPMDTIIANEPVNPLAPIAEELVKQKRSSSKRSAGNKVSTIFILAPFFKLIEHPGSSL